MDTQTRLDVVLDTDAYNEIDDQFAIAYLLRSHDVLHVCALYAAPFFNDNSCSAQDGLYKSYDEILKVLSLAGRSDLARCVFHGSENYLPDEYTPVFSDAAQHLADLAGKYTPEQPLYVIAIGAITNVASAILLNPKTQKIWWLFGWEEILTISTIPKNLTCIKTSPPHELFSLPMPMWFSCRATVLSANFVPQNRSLPTGCKEKTLCAIICTKIPSTQQRATPHGLGAGLFGM